VTDATFGCEEAITFVLGNQVAAIAVNITNTTSVSCVGLADGSVEYTVNPNIGTQRIMDGLGQEYDADALPKGFYCIEALDDNGCLAGSACFYIEEPELLFVEITRLPATCSTGGSINTAISGGNGTYQLNWTDIGATTELTRTNVAAGTYAFSLEDAKGCTAIADGIIISTTQGPSITAAATASTTATSTDGSASVAVDGGVEPYTYEWSTGSTDQAIDNLSPGEYTVTVKDANGCTETTTVMIGVDCTLEVKLFPTAAGCAGNDGSLVAETTGTNNTVTYTWSTGATGRSIIGLSQGFYSVTATDAAGCTASTGVMLRSTRSLPIISNIIQVDATTKEAKDGAIKIELQSEGNFTYQWSDPVITGASGTNLMAGRYTVTISEAADPDCSITETILVGNANMPTLIEVTY